MDVIKRMLHSGWEFAYADHAAVTGPDDMGDLTFRPATVPGTNLTDLQAAGLVAADTATDYEDTFACFPYMDFVYRTEFEGGEDAERRHVFLCFDGLDTICDIFLNGEQIGTAENAYLRYQFEVTGKVRHGRNALLLLFRSPILGAADLQRRGTLKFPAHLDCDFMYIRKPAYSFFWDWGPEMPVSGIYRPAYLKAYDRAEIEDFQVRYTLEGRRVTGTVRVTAPGADGCRVVLHLAGNTTEATVAEGEATVAFGLEEANLWYPNGEGEPYLYEMRLTLEDGEVLDARDHRIGFRTVEVLRDERSDRPGKRFRFRVNGREVFCRGYNWIPVDSSLPRGYYDLYRGNLDLAQQGNVNMLRVWGGGYYEDDEFYRMCDERGIMVWQDGMFTCSMYPDMDPGFLKLVEAELADNIKRLRNYTSLVLWCGENESHWGWEEWWVELREQFHRFYGIEIFDTMFALLVVQNDPDRFYWNGSPYSGEANVRANDPHYGDTHYWTLHTNCEDYSHYANTRPSFVSETGIQSLPDLRTAQAIGNGQEQRILSFVMDTRNHFESPAKNERLLKFTGALFEPGETFAEQVVRSNLAHAEYLKYAVEHWRSQTPNCGGVLIWQLNDCWPAISWAVVDYYLIPKAAFYYLQRAFAPDIIGFVQHFPINYNPEATARGHLFVASERDGHKTGVVEVHSMSLTGEVWSTQVFPVTMEGRGAVSLGELALPDYRARRFDSVARMVLRWDDGTTATNLYTFSRPKHMHLAQPRIAIRQAAPDRLTVRSDTFAKAVYLYHRDRAIMFADNYFDLLPGEERSVWTTRPMDAAEVHAMAYYHR